MVKWGVRSMVWYVFMLIIAFCVSLYYYHQFISDPTIQRVFFG